MGEQGLAIVESILSGEAKQRGGLPYRDVVLIRSSALHAAYRLGPLAYCLEDHLREGVRDGFPQAAQALGRFDRVSDATIAALAAAVAGPVETGPDMELEALAAMIRLGIRHHPAFDAFSKKGGKRPEILAKWLVALPN